MLKPLACCLALCCLVPALAAQADAPEPWLRERAAAVGMNFPWQVQDPRLLEEGRNGPEVKASIQATAEFDRAAALDQALAEAKAAGRLVLWYCPRILAAEPGFTPGRQMYRPAIVDAYARSVLFSDPEIEALVRARFVAVRLAADEALGERFGLKAPTVVEPALIVLSGEGAVLRRIDRLRTFNAGFVWRWLQAALPPSRDPVTPSDLDELEQASLQGHSVTLPFIFPLDSAPTAEEQARLVRSRAAHARRHGRLDEALSALQEASSADAATALERGRIELARGDLDAAAAALRQVQGGALRAEALYLLALIDWYRGHTELAERRLHATIAADPSGPFAARAALDLLDGKDYTSVGPLLHGFVDPFFRPLSEAPTTARPRAPEELPAMSKDALAFLLRMQRDHGGWTDSRYAYWPNPDLTPNVWVATTALSCAALLAFREHDPIAIDEALARGERYLFDEARMARGHQEEIYADLYKLFYLQEKFKRARGPEEREALTERARVVVREITRQQETEGDRAGFFGHEYPNGFTTAAVMNGLERARGMGVHSTRPVQRKGASALLRIRDEAGSYGYSASRMPRGDQLTRERNSMARSPISEAALLWAEAEGASSERVQVAVERFFTHLPRLEAIRTCDYHTDGELGGFFFWHGVFHTIESLEALPAAARTDAEARLRTFLATLQEKDGSFLDSHEMGKSYGTAMALLSIARVLERGP